MLTVHGFIRGSRLGELQSSLYFGSSSLFRASFFTQKRYKSSGTPFTSQTQTNHGCTLRHVHRIQLDSTPGIFGMFTFSVVCVSARPSPGPTAELTSVPTESPSSDPTLAPTDDPTGSPSISPTASPSSAPTEQPTSDPTASPTECMLIFQFA